MLAQIKIDTLPIVMLALIITPQLAHLGCFWPHKPISCAKLRSWGSNISAIKTPLTIKLILIDLQDLLVLGYKFGSAKITLQKKLIFYSLCICLITQ